MMNNGCFVKPECPFFMKKASLNNVTYVIQ
jgi:hypothetical protein